MIRPEAEAPVQPALPLVVDLDGTLTPTDTLLESMVHAVSRHPSTLWRAPWWLLSTGRAGLKDRLAAAGRMAVDRLPITPEVLDYIHRARAMGRRVILATAADRVIAHAVAQRLGVFDEVLASDGQLNLKGASKLQMIQARVGPDFEYAGDSRADLPIWSAAKSAVLVNVSAAVRARVQAGTPVALDIQSRGRSGLAACLEAMRLHQWLKNILVFVPLLTSFSFGQTDKALASVLAFVAFSLLASATYLLNDIGDLDNDRAHPRKKDRPIASGLLPLPQAVLAALGLGAAALALASWVSAGFVAALLSYLALTLLYSLRLKRLVLLDVVTLAVLYALRVLAGAAAINVHVTPWLLAFCVFVFFSLALVKRCSELVAFGHRGDQPPQPQESLPGRDYRLADLAVLWPLGVGSALCAVVIFGLFITTVTESAKYAHPELLWAVGVGLIYWLGRLWIATARGQMHDDPVVYTLKDRTTRLLLIAMVLVTIGAYLRTPLPLAAVSSLLPAALAAATSFAMPVAMTVPLSAIA